MHIVSSSLALSAAHSRETVETSRETLQVTAAGAGGGRRERSLGQDSVRTTADGGQQRLLDFRDSAAAKAFPDLLALARRIATAAPTEGPAATAAQMEQATAAAEEPGDLLEGTGISLPELAVIAAFVEKLTGHRLRLFSGRGMRSAGQATQAAPTARGPAVGVVYQRHTELRESERSSFQGQGVVQTADGRQITLDVQVNLSREFVQTQDTELRLGAALKDPLVINLDGGSAHLDTTRFSFDLDADGSAEQIASLAPGSAYLAMDRNGDGKVNDGSELFGPTSGNGYTELARLDQDGNGWIDEADAAWSRLKVWGRDAAGNEQLLAVADAGLGAIYLGHAATPFSLRDGSNTELGQLSASGVFLFEDGRAGSVQQLDLTV